MPKIKDERQTSVREITDNLVSEAIKALEKYMELEKADKIAHAMVLAGIEHHVELAKLAHEEAGGGVIEDKIIKNMFSTEYTKDGLALQAIGRLSEMAHEDQWLWAKFVDNIFSPRLWWGEKKGFQLF